MKSMSLGKNFSIGRMFSISSGRAYLNLKTPNKADSRLDFRLISARVQEFFFSNHALCPFLIEELPGDHLSFGKILHY